MYVRQCTRIMVVHWDARECTGMLATWRCWWSHLLGRMSRIIRSNMVWACHVTLMPVQTRQFFLTRLQLQNRSPPSRRLSWQFCSQAPTSLQFGLSRPSTEVMTWTFLYHFACLTNQALCVLTVLQTILEHILVVYTESLAMYPHTLFGEQCVPGSLLLCTTQKRKPGNRSWEWS